MRCPTVARPLLARGRHHILFRTFTTTPLTRNAATPTEPLPVEPINPLDLDPNTVLPQHEAALIKAGKMPIGSRRRRVAIRSTPNSLPFEQLPYQAFQEARKILAADRQDKLVQIQKELNRIALLEGRAEGEFKAGMKETRLASLRRHVEELKILADVNDPIVRKRFEDGLGDMNKPIYRHYALQKYNSYAARLITQRIAQFNIVPDILPKLQPTASVELFFRSLKIPPGNIVDSAVSEVPPRLKVQVFDQGERLVSVVVLDADVPDVENDGFTKRCHFLAANVRISPTDTSLPLSKIKGEDQLALPWLPPHSQKGAQYHRLAIFLLEQPANTPISVATLKELYSDRSTPFSLKSLRDKFALTPVGFNMFRSVWDENTAAVMARHGLAGADVEFRPTRVYSLKPPVKARGWEAKRQGPKFRHLWKYTKRIKGYSNARGLTKRR